jgi:tRNA A-37 threonylcarbamoyl transferase component Bud32
MPSLGLTTAEVLLSRVCPVAGCALYSRYIIAYALHCFLTTTGVEMTRTLQATYQWLTRTSVVGCALVLILLITLILCLANFNLIKYAAIGILLGGIFWKVPRLIRIMLFIVALVVFVAACVGTSAPRAIPQFNWTATYKAEIALNSNGKVWTINEQVTVPATALRQITEADGKYTRSLPSPKPNQYKLDTGKLGRMMKPGGWIFIGMENGNNPMFSLRQRSVAHPIPTIPLVTTQAISLPYVSLLGDVNVIPGNDSSVIITGPSAVIVATTPASEAKVTITGEERIIEAGSFGSIGADSINVSIGTLSILARAQPVRTLAGLSLSGWISFVIAGIWMLLVSLVQSGAKKAGESGWQRFRGGKAPPNAEKPGQRKAREEAEPGYRRAPRLLGGRYELEGVVGRGGMAEVYRARDIRLDRVVAIKTLRADLARDQIFQARFRREAQSAASLNHPSIVAVYDTGEDMATGVPVPYIVMEYVDGRTVRDLLSEGHRLLPERSLEIIDGVLRALDYSHQAGIVHRDIKPGNVMVTRNGDVKVMDFSLTGPTRDEPVSNPAVHMIRTVLYLSPEQARGERVDSRSDLYSTGCLLYELLTGRPPFTGDSPVAIAYQHVRENPVPPSRVDPDVPPWADAIVLRAMAKSPADRYQTAADMRADLQRAASGLPVAAAPPRPGIYTSLTRSRPRRWPFKS